MKRALGELLPSRAFSQRMLELETELKRARAFQRRHSKSSETVGRWGLDTPAESQQEEGWFITYLDMMTLLLVVMIVMLAFSGTLNWQDEKSSEQLATNSVTEQRVGMETMGIAEQALHHDAAILSTSGLEVSSGSAATPVRPGGDGLLPGGSGLMPRHFGLADVSAVSAPPPGGTPHQERGNPFEHRPKSMAELYPGWAPDDLAASFVGPPLPPTVGGEEAVAPGVALRDAPEAPGYPSQAARSALAEGLSPAEEMRFLSNESDLLSEGQAMAAGLSLAELGNDVEVVINERSVSFRVNSEILFDSSQADLSRSGLAVLRRIVSVLSDSNHEVTVEGHTDSVPVRRNARYPSNWELSSARAGSVVRYLQSNGIDRSRLKAVGYADTRPIADNHTPDGRAGNRRVELLIEKRD